jgi:putative Mn2+ efflux pump MntP
MALISIVVLALGMSTDAFAAALAMGARQKSANFLDALERQPIGLLVITAIGTSIDAMAIGVTLALINANIVIAAGAIGITSVALSTAGVMMGWMAGLYLGRLAELAGGVLLIAIGAHILLDHLGLI